MKYFSILVALTILNLPISNAAKFEKIEHFKNNKLETLSKEIAKLFADEKLRDSLSIATISSYSFTRKSEEQDLNTVKQFNIKYLGQYSNDDMGATAVELKNKSAKELVNGLFSAVNITDYSDDEQPLLYKTKNAITSAIIKNTNSLNSVDFKYFNGEHSDEDGSWGIINIIDTKNNELLALKLGNSGT